KHISYKSKKKLEFQLLVVYHYCLDFACLALWSFKTAFRDRLIRPWLSISITFTIISSPMATTSSTLFVLFSSNSDMWTSPSFPLNNSTKAPNFSIRFTVPRYISPTSPSRTMSSIMLRSEEHTSELQSRFDLVCPLLLVNTNQH